MAAMAEGFIRINGAEEAVEEAIGTTAARMTDMASVRGVEGEDVVVDFEAAAAVVGRLTEIGTGQEQEVGKMITTNTVTTRLGKIEGDEKDGWRTIDRRRDEGRQTTDTRDLANGTTGVAVLPLTGVAVLLRRVGSLCLPRHRRVAEIKTKEDSQAPTMRRAISPVRLRSRDPGPRNNKNPHCRRHLPTLTSPRTPKHNRRLRQHRLCLGSSHSNHHSCRRSRSTFPHLSTNSTRSNPSRGPRSQRSGDRPTGRFRPPNK
jgi:hypothetical protein